jgi:hypothetical protein
MRLSRSGHKKQEKTHNFFHHTPLLFTIRQATFARPAVSYIARRAAPSAAGKTSAKVDLD